MPGNRLSKEYPKFEKSSGWRLHSHYPAPLSDAMRRELTAFYEPYNEALFTYLGHRLVW